MTLKNYFLVCVILFGGFALEAQEYHEKTIDYVNNDIIKKTDGKPIILPKQSNKRRTAKRYKKSFKQTLNKQRKSEDLITNLKASSSGDTSNVGRTTDKLTVSLSGAASYNMPIKLPVGIQDITPVIGLSFNSHASNGLVGWGWSISGLSSISRVPSTKYHDGFKDGLDFDNRDRFALDGQRLLVKSGKYGARNSEYQTENYSNIRITSHGISPFGSDYGPSFFVVHYPDGSRGWYGNGNGSGRLEWALTRYQDSQGNYIEYNYFRENNLLRIANIKYGKRGYGESPNVIYFHYKTRVRPEITYVKGESFKRAKILDYIEVKNESQLYRKYELRHDVTSLGYQRVASIQEFNSSNESLPAILFNYGSSEHGLVRASGDEYKIYPGFNYKSTRMVSGEFNGDGRTDYILTKGDDFYVFDRIFQPDIHEFPTKVSTDGYENIFASTILTNSGSVFSVQGITTVKETLLNDFEEIRFRTYTLSASGGGVQYDKIVELPLAPKPTGHYYCENTDKVDRKIPREYISGDFNGDGLTDALAINLRQSRWHCNFVENQGCHCNPTRDFVDNTVYFLDLKRSSQRIIYGAGVLYSAPDGSGIRKGFKGKLFPIDFDGDGKTDLMNIDNQRVKVYTLNVNNQLEEMASYVENPQTPDDDSVAPHKLTLFGDYNGDGKTDFAQPVREDSSEWRFFLSKGNTLEVYEKNIGVNYKKTYLHKGSKYVNFVRMVNPYYEFHYISQDLNGDGKSDILKHEIISPWSSKDKVSERIQLYANKQNSNDSSPSFELVIDDLETNNGTVKLGIPLFLEGKLSNSNLEYAYIYGNNVNTYEFIGDNKNEVTLESIENNGVKTSLTYKTLGLEHFYNPTYTPENHSVKYPYVNVNLAPSMKLVSKLTQTASGHTRTQQFKYKGAVSHMWGLGFMGFTALARSNTYGDNVSALWNISKHDPKLRGAATEQWTSESYSFNQNCYINKTVTGYHTEFRPNKVFVNLPKHMATHNNITQVLHERFFTYDGYFNLETEREKTEGLDKITTYRYYNNPSLTYANYHIGRPRWEKSVAKVPGAADFWTETSYTYQNNLLKTEQQRINNSPWVSTTYGYDRFGNVTSKTLATAGKASRTETFGYSPDGRDMKWHKDVLGLTTSYEYYPYGALKKETDPYGNSTHYVYDGWNRLHKTTNYLGRETVVTYAHRSGGGTIKTINHPNTGADTKTYYNALGWVDEVHTQVSSSQWSKVYYKYDAAGRVFKESVPDFTRAKKWNTNYYDVYGRISTLQQANGKTINTTYDGLRTQVSDGTKTATTTKNALDQIVELADPGGTIQYRYHANGELREADYGGYVVKTEIDLWGRKSKLIDPTAGTFTYKHNAFGELLEETAPKGKTIYKHDDYGRLITKTWTGDLTNMVTSYVFDPTTKLLDYEETTDNLNGTTHRIKSEYDSYKRLKKLHEKGTHANFAKIINYDYYGRVYNEQFYATDNISKKTYNTNAVYSYDQTGSTDKLSYRGYAQYELWRANEYNALGQVKRATKGNGFVQTKTIDPFGYVTAITDLKGSSANQKALDLSYNYDVARGLLLSRSDRLLGINNQQFVYDDMDRLTEAHRDTKGKTKTRTRGYDPRGRLTQDSFMGVHLTYGAGNDRYRLTGAELNPVGDAYYSKHKERNISYNADRKPVEVHDVGNGRITFNYSHDGHRQEVWYGGEETEKTKRKYHKTYSRIAPIELVRDLENDTQKFLTYVGGDAYTAPVVHVKDTDSSKPNGYHYLHRDYLGSILAVSNSSGEVIERAHFGAWGDVAVISTGSITGSQDPELVEGAEAAIAFADTLTGRGFTGHEHFTEVGLVHMNGRMYDPMQGRFLSPDNHIQDPFNTQNFNRFGYVLNNPLAYIDWSGESFWRSIGRWIKRNSKIITTIAVITVAVVATIATAGMASPFLAGAIVGASAGFTAGAVGTWTSGGSFADGLKNGLIQGAIGGIAGGIGASVGAWASKNIGSAVINGFNVTSPVLKGAIGGAIGGAAGGYAGGFAAGGLSTGSIKQAHKMGLQNMAFGAALGTVTGAAQGYKYAKEAGINPWTGKYDNAAMIGGGQDRVDMFAKDLGAKTISETWPSDLKPYIAKDTPNPNAQDFNQLWIDGVIGKNRPILDIGPVKPYSHFYNGVELNSIRATGYQNVLTLKTNYWFGIRFIRW